MNRLFSPSAKVPVPSDGHSERGSVKANSWVRTGTSYAVPFSAEDGDVTKIEGTGGRDDAATDIQDIADKLWQAADKLRGTVDAAEYKHVVLGLLFLKYISDSFESRRAKLKEELAAEGISGEHLEQPLENRDEYTAERVL